MTLHHLTTSEFAKLIMATVRHRRKRRFQSLLTLAEAAGYHATTICQWELGRGKPTLRQALDCLEAVG